MEPALKAEDVAERLGLHINSVYRLKRKLGGVQLVPRGRLLFSEKRINEILEQKDAISVEEREVESHEDDKREAERKDAPHRTRRDSLGRVAKRRRVGSVYDPYNVLGLE